MVTVSLIRMKRLSESTIIIVLLKAEPEKHAAVLNAA